MTDLSLRAPGYYFELKNKYVNVVIVAIILDEIAFRIKDVGGLTRK